MNWLTKIWQLIFGRRKPVYTDPVEQPDIIDRENPPVIEPAKKNTMEDKAPAVFYDKIRPMFGGRITQKQFQGIEAIIQEYAKRQLTDKRWLAYILATVKHETGDTMQPIAEYGKGKGRDYGKKLDMGQGPGRRVPYNSPDHLYYGRGLVQVTWLTNYRNLAKAAQRQGYDWDFVNNPELLFEMEPSVWAAFHGMITGLFTGKKLADYFNASTENWVHARKIINGLDKAELIAGYGKIFYKALS